MAKREEHPWKAFKVARAKALRWLRDECGESAERSAKTMSMDPTQVRLILATPIAEIEGTMERESERDLGELSKRRGSAAPSFEKEKKGGEHHGSEEENRGGAQESDVEENGETG